MKEEKKVMYERISQYEKEVEDKNNLMSRVQELEAQ